MYKMLMKSCKIAVEIESDINLYDMIKDKIDFIDFPEISLEEINNGSNCNYKIHYSNTNKREIDYKENVLFINYPIEEMNGGLNVLFLSYPIIEMERQKNKSLTCHCAAVSLNGKGILILGKEGSGKTTLTLELCRNYNAKLIGNDLCVLDYKKLDYLKLLGGTKYVFLRYESIKRNIPALLDNFDNSNNEKLKDTWTFKKKVSASDLGIEVEHNDVDIDKILIVHIDQEKEFYKKDANSLANLLYLNENFSRYIRNTCTAMINNNNIIDYIPSLDTKDLFNQRKELINYLLNNKKIEYLSGNTVDICKYIISGGN